MNVRIFWAHVMECICTQTRLIFKLSSKRVSGGMESELMLTPREKSHLQEKFSSEENQTHGTASNRTGSPTYYQLSYSGPFPCSTMLTWAKVRLWKFQYLEITFDMLTSDLLCATFDAPVKGFFCDLKSIWFFPLMTSWCQICCVVLLWFSIEWCWFRMIHAVYRVKLLTLNSLSVIKHESNIYKNSPGKWLILDLVQVFLMPLCEEGAWRKKL